MHISDLPPVDRQFFGPGYSCQLLQVTPGQLKVLMEAAGVEFVATLDAVPLIDGVGMQALVNKANELRAEIADAAEKVGKKCEKAGLN